ncbi:TonB-dependent receptor [Adhaeribacter sp. BT258]|uniref:TonB-dependent receptor n=1 Tax=Adhaeribacter terrigena TaxID=2793070 RepID=A0ABS1C281_9BACT|nr:TonB-dependent receptor [Adhaeribacter terrigena]MBK0403511.1 TonB-dependent receptor [Adhaeribacter terrigena]
MKNSLVLLCLLFLVNGSVLAQKTSVLRGTIRDAATQEILPGVSVYLPEHQTGIVTNAEGKYELKISGEKAKVVFSLIGFAKVEKEVNLIGNTELNIALQQDANTLQEVEISAKKNELRDQVFTPQMSTLKISPQQIKHLPSIGGEVDIIKVAQLMPGVKRGGEGQTGMYVRGGGVDQNLILLDDAPVYNVGHLFGFFSVFNNDALQDVSLIKGSFPAQYGGRISSVMDIKTQNGDAEKIKAEGGIGLLSSRVTVQGPIQKDKFTFLISARRSYLDKVLGVAGLKIPYYFYDTNLKLHYKLSDKDKISFSSYYGNDVLSEPKAGGNDEDLGMDFGFTLGNFTNTLRWQHRYSDKLFSSLTLLHTRFRYQVNGRFDQNSLFIGSYIEDLGLKLDYDYAHNSRNQLRYGLSVTNHRFRPNIVATQGEISDYVKSQEGRKLNPQEMAAYAQNEFKATSRLTLSYGLRASGLFTSGKTYAGLEPRASAVLQLTENSSLKAGYSRMFQYLHLVSNSSLMLPTDLWYPVTKQVKPQYADQIALGYNHHFPKRNTLLSAEIYYKKLYRLMEYKEGAQLMLNDNYERELLRGNGEAYGAELFLHKTEGRFNGWIGYSLSWATRQFDGLNNGKTFYAKYDRRHDISIVTNYEISKRLSISAVWVYGTGQRLTGRLGQYFTPKPSYSGVDVLPVYTDRNALKFSPSHRLDLNLVLKNKPHKRWQSEWCFGAYNVYNQTQPYRVKVEPNGKGGYKYSQVGLFGFIPSIAYNFKF